MFALFRISDPAGKKKLNCNVASFDMRAAMSL